MNTRTSTSDDGAGHNAGAPPSDLERRSAAGQTGPNPLGSELTALAAHIDAATFRFLTLVLQFDLEAGWGITGALSCAHWLNYFCGIGIKAAHEKVRVAHRLAECPLISEAFENGLLSYSKVRAVTRVATPENEALLLELARQGSAAHVEKIVRSYRRVLDAQDRERANTRHDERALHYRYCEDGSVVMEVRLAPEDAAIVKKSIDAALDSLRPATCDRQASVDSGPASSSRTHTPPYDDWARCRADALVHVAEGFLAASASNVSNAERFEVVVHVDAHALSNTASITPARCDVADGGHLAIDTVRRIMCASPLVPVLDDEDGEPLNIGRRTRAIPPAIRRALRLRDDGCRFPGCTHKRFIDAHHIEHWANGGETKLSNLVELCKRHHRWLHEGGFDIEVDATGELHFKNAKGIAISTTPPGHGISPDAPNLEQQNRGHEVNIHADNLIPMTDDTRMDIDMVMDGLLQCDDKLLLKQLISQREEHGEAGTRQIRSTPTTNNGQTGSSIAS